MPKKPASFVSCCGISGRQRVRVYQFADSNGNETGPHWQNPLDNGRKNLALSKAPLVYTENVGGSRPSPPTNLFKGLQPAAKFSMCTDVPQNIVAALASFINEGEYLA
jgi:hypothetical protein